MALALFCKALIAIIFDCGWAGRFVLKRYLRTLVALVSVWAGLRMQ
jgi:hypothetical protein